MRLALAPTLFLAGLSVGRADDASDVEACKRSVSMQTHRQRVSADKMADFVAVCLDDLKPKTPERLKSLNQEYTLKAARFLGIPPSKISRGLLCNGEQDVSSFYAMVTLPNSISPVVAYFETELGDIGYMLSFTEMLGQNMVKEKFYQNLADYHLTNNHCATDVLLGPVQSVPKQFLHFTRRETIIWNAPDAFLKAMTDLQAGATAAEVARYHVSCVMQGSETFQSRPLDQEPGFYRGWARDGSCDGYAGWVRTIDVD